MRRRTLLILLAGAAAFLAALAAVVRKHDGGYLLEFGNISYDLAGDLRERLNAARRDCSHVQVLSASDDDWNRIHAGLEEEVDENATVVMRQVLRAGPWYLVEAEFANGEPGVMLLEKAGEGYRDAANWGGSAAPFRTPPAIRAFLKKEVPAVPGPLLQCFDPAGPPFTS